MLLIEHELLDAILVQAARFDQSFQRVTFSRNAAERTGTTPLADRRNIFPTFIVLYHEDKSKVLTAVKNQKTTF